MSKLRDLLSKHRQPEHSSLFAGEVLAAEEIKPDLSVAYIQKVAKTGEIDETCEGYFEAINLLVDNPGYLDRQARRGPEEKAALKLICHEIRKQAAELAKPMPPIQKAAKSKTSTVRERGKRFQLVGNMTMDLLAAKYGIYETTLAKGIEFSWGANLRRGAKVVVMDKTLTEAMSPELAEKYRSSFAKGCIPIYCLGDIYTLTVDYLRKKD